MDKIFFHHKGGIENAGDEKHPHSVPQEGADDKIKQNNKANLGLPPILEEEDILNKWFKMIAKAKIEMVFEELVEYLINSSDKQYYFEEVILMSNRWNSLMKDFNRGLITYEQRSSFENRICKWLFSFLEGFKSIDKR